MKENISLRIIILYFLWYSFLFHFSTLERPRTWVPPDSFWADKQYQQDRPANTLPARTKEGWEVASITVQTWLTTGKFSIVDVVAKILVPSLMKKKKTKTKQLAPSPNVNVTITIIINPQPWITSLYSSSCREALIRNIKVQLSRVELGWFISLVLPGKTTALENAGPWAIFYL